MVSDSIIASVGWSTRADALQAGKEAAIKARAHRALLRSHLAIVFGSSRLDPSEMLQGIRSILGDIPVVGGSTAGEITPEGPISHSCVVLLVSSDTLVARVGLAEHMGQHPRDAGHQVAYATAHDMGAIPRVAFVLFGDGLIMRYTEVAHGLREVLGTKFLIAGGMAGDDFRYSETYQYCNGRAATGAIAGVLLGGGVSVGVGIEHGFAPISKPRRITSARDNFLLQLDDQPAASVYDEYFGPELVTRMRTEGLTRRSIAYPLGMQCAPAGQWLLRNVVAFGEDGSLACTGEMLEGAWLQLMIGSPELAIQAAYRAAQQAVRSLNRVAFVLVFDSALRRTLLGTRHAALELLRIREAVGSSAPVAGCYTYGEYAPIDSGDREQSTVQTGSVLVIAVGT